MRRSALRLLSGLLVTADSVREYEKATDYAGPLEETRRGCIRPCSARCSAEGATRPDAEYRCMIAPARGSLSRRCQRPCRVRSLSWSASMDSAERPKMSGTGQPSSPA